MIDSKSALDVHIGALVFNHCHIFQQPTATVHGTFKMGRNMDTKKTKIVNQLK